MAPLFPRLFEPDDRTALAFAGEALTYRELARACRNHLDRLGAQPGERVAVWTHPTIATPLVLAAHAIGGIVSVPLNPKLGDKELGHILGDAKPTHVIDPRELTIETDGAGALPECPVDATPLLILYTSGTTGPPKGAVLSRTNVAVDLDGLARAWELVGARHGGPRAPSVSRARARARSVRVAPRRGRARLGRTLRPSAGRGRAPARPDDALRRAHHLLPPRGGGRGRCEHR